MFTYALILLPILFLLHSAVAYSCSQQAITVKYNGYPYFFPPQGTDDHYDTHLNCTWIIQIPDGYYLDWGFKSNFTTVFPSEFSDYLSAIYRDNGDATEASYYGKNDLESQLINDKLTLNLITHKKEGGSFRFNVTWIKLAPTTPITVIAIDDYGYSAVELNGMNDNHTIAFSIGEDSQVTLTAAWVSNENVRDIWVYDGIGAIGNDYMTLLESAIITMNSKKHAFTLYNPFSTAPLSHAIAFAQDYRNVLQFDDYDVFYSLPYANQTCEMYFPSFAKKPYATTFYSPNEISITLYDIDFNTKTNATIYAYIGVATPLNINRPDVSFSFNDTPSQLPYSFNSSVVTFVMKEEGVATLYTYPPNMQIANAIDNDMKKKTINHNRPI